MQGNIHSLQFLHKPTVVGTRQDAIKTIERLFAANSLVAEPYIVFYKDADAANPTPNAVIALGTPVNEEVFIIDTKLDKEEINTKVDSLSKELSERIDNLKETEAKDYKDALEKLNEINKILNKRIDDLTKVVEANEVFVESTDTLILKKEGQVITGEVVISKEGAKSKSVVDDNILVNQDGLYVAVDMKLKNNKLSLITSGYDAQGNVQTDVVKREIDLSDILFEVSPAEFNILRFEDGKLYVDGRAKNIKYKKGTVAEALGNVEEKVEVLQKLELSVNPKTNKLSITVGDNTKEVDLPGLDLVDKVEYDKKNHEIVITFKDGSKAPINMLEVLSTFKFMDSSTLNLHSEIGSKGGIQVSGDVKLSNRDNNVLRALEDGLYVDADVVTGATIIDVERAVEAEKNRAEKAEALLDKTITAEVSRAKEAEAGLDRVIAEEATRADNAEKALGMRIDGVEKTAEDNKSAIQGLNEQFTSFNTDYEAHKAKHETEFADLTKVVEKNTEDVKILNGQISDLEKYKAQHNAEYEAVKGQVEVNKADIANLKDKTDDLNVRLTDYVGTHAAEYEAVKTSIEVVKAELSGKVDENKAEIANIKEQVTSNKEAILGEVTRAELAEEALSARVAATEQAVTTLNGAEETPDSVRHIVKHYVERVQDALANEIDRSKTEDANLKDLIKTTADNLEGKLTDANNAAVTNLTDAINAEVARAKEAEAGLQNAIDSHNSVAKEYTDGEIDKVTLRLTADEADIANLKENIIKKVENIVLTKSQDNDLQYFLLVDEKMVGEINIPKDNFLEDVSYDSASHILNMRFTVGKDNQTQVAAIDLSELIDVYLAGNGLMLKDNVFSLMYNAEGDEGYLKIDGNGICVNGLNAKFDAKANPADVYGKDEAYTKAEADVKFITEHQSLDEYAKTADVEKTYATKEEIGIFATAETVNGIATTVAEHTETLRIVNGNEAEEGSIKKALSDAKAYTDNKVVEEAEKRSELSNSVTEKLAEKANLADVYTKAEIDANNFLTEHQDISHLATKEGVNAVDEQAKANAEAITLLNDIEGREGSVANTVAVTRNILQEKIDEKANSVDVYSKTEADATFVTKLEAEDFAHKQAVNDLADAVAVHTDVLNIVCGNEAEEGSIKKALKDAMAYTDAEIAKDNTDLKELIVNKANAEDVYTKAEADAKFRSEVKLVGENDNSLVYTLMVDGVACGQINIPKDNFIKSVTYDPALKALKFVYEVQSEGGMESSIIVPVADFVQTYFAGDAIAIDAENKISVKKSVVSEKYLSVTDAGIAIVGIDAELKDIKDVINAVGADLETAKSGLADVEKAIAECNFLNGAASSSVEVKIAKNAGNSQFDITADVLVSAEPKNMVVVKHDGLYAVTPICNATDNLIEDHEDGLFVSNKASNIKIIYNGEEKDVQVAFHDLAQTVDSFKNIGEDIYNAVDKVNGMSDDVNALKQTVNTHETKLGQQQTAIDAQQKAIDDLKSDNTDYQKEIDKLKAENENQAQEIEDLKKEIADIKNMLNTITDFGTYKV